MITTRAPRQVLLVCGLHPSGLSMVLTGLRALGCQTGSFTPVQQAAEATNHYEWPTFVNLNEKLIKGAPPEPLERLAQSMLAGFPGPAPIVLKDPKARQTLPFWHRQIRAWGGQLRVLVVLHRPDNPHLRGMVAAGRWVQNLAGLLQDLTVKEGELVLIPQDQLRARPSATLLELAEHLALGTSKDAKPDFDHWMLGHGPLGPQEPAGGVTGADLAANAVYAALIPNHKVVAYSALTARETICKALKPAAE